MHSQPYFYTFDIPDVIVKKFQIDSENVKIKNPAFLLGYDGFELLKVFFLTL